MAIKGVLQSISSKQGITNGRAWTMYQYKLDNGNTYIAFKKFPVQEGDTVEINMENNNGKWKVKNIQAVTQSQPAPQKQIGSNFSADREISIQRQSSIKAAIDIINNKLNPADVIKLAQLLVEYCQNGESEQLLAKLDEMILEDVATDVAPFDLDEIDKEDQ
jgi:hypothetical protein